MNVPIFYARSVIAKALLTLPSNGGQDADSPVDHLNDGDVVIPYRYSATSSGDREVIADQGSSGPVGSTGLLPADTLIIPAGHSFSGLSLTLFGSQTGSTWDTYLTATSSGSGELMLKALSTGTSTKRFWRLYVASPLGPIYAAEWILALAVTMPGGMQAADNTRYLTVPGSQVDRSVGGYAWGYERHPMLNGWEYTLANRLTTDRDATFELYRQLQGRAFYLLDHNGDLRRMVWVEEPTADHVPSKDGPRWTMHLRLLETF